MFRRIQLENKTNQLKKGKADVGSLWENHKEFVKNKLIVKSQQRFRSKKHYVLTEEVKTSLDRVLTMTKKNKRNRFNVNKLNGKNKEIIYRKEGN